MMDGSDVPDEIMDDCENRQITRDSLFLLADVRLDGVDGDHRAKVRNLSAGGMMGEGAVYVRRGTALKVQIRNIGWVEGTVAWVQSNRFGVAFADEIDPKLARAPLIEGDHTPRYARTPLPTEEPRPNLRKV